MNLIKNCKDSWNHIPYTWKHYLAFLKVEKQYIGYYKYKFHDWDKLFMFIFIPFLGERFINQFHQKHQKHHPTYTTGVNWDSHNKNPNSIRWDEAIIDWECARYTKPDKPLNARDTMEKYYPQFKSYCEPILNKLGL